ATRRTHRHGQRQNECRCVISGDGAGLVPPVTDVRADPNVPLAPTEQQVSSTSTRAMRAYIFATVVAAVAICAVLSQWRHQQTPSPWIVAVLLITGFVAARFPLHLTEKTKLFVDTSVFTAAAIVLSPVWAAGV